jgi:hypothetical protein
MTIEKRQSENTAVRSPVARRRGVSQGSICVKGASASAARVMIGAAIDKIMSRKVVRLRICVDAKGSRLGDDSSVTNARSLKSRIDMLSALLGIDSAIHDQSLTRSQVQAKGGGK